jgi:hypothetical protein
MLKEMIENCNREEPKGHTPLQKFAENVWDGIPLRQQSRNQTGNGIPDPYCIVTAYKNENLRRQLL